MTRVVNESAELVNLINTRFLGVANPGLKCGNENPAAALAAGQDGFSEASQTAIRRNAQLPQRLHLRVPRLIAALEKSSLDTGRCVSPPTIASGAPAAINGNYRRICACKKGT